MELDLNTYQDIFLFSEARYPALISSIGTGKTYMLLLKAWMFCDKYPDSLALVVRREYTDLRDSTINDFETYFGVKINQGNKEFEFPNKSKIMFRHGDLNDINVLKNINLNFIGIEQAEEYESPDVFDFLRDRLRRKTSPIRQMCVIANANGHNWLYDRFVNNAEMNIIDAETGVIEYKRDEYHCCTANTLANKHNLPDDFIADLMKMKDEAPNHFQQYVMNSFDDIDEDDYLFPYSTISPCINKEFIADSPTGVVIMGVDIARYGNDSSSAYIMERQGSYRWKEIDCVIWNGQDTMQSVGRILELKQRYNVADIAIDGDGLGAGVVDRIKELNCRVLEFRGGLAPQDEKMLNQRAENYFKLRDYFKKEWISINNSKLISELQTIRFKYNSSGKMQILSKEEMRSKGLKSPDVADSAMMCMMLVDIAGNMPLKRKRQLQVGGQWSTF